MNQKEEVMSIVNQLAMGCKLNKALIQVMQDNLAFVPDCAGRRVTESILKIMEMVSEKNISYAKKQLKYMENQNA